MDRLVRVVLLALLGQGVVIYLAMRVVPVSTTFTAAMPASWITAVVGTMVAYVGSAGTDDALTSALARRSRTRAGVPTPRWTARCSSSWTASRSPSCGGRPVRRRTDDPALAVIRRLPAQRVDAAAPPHDPGQPARHPARHGARVPAFRWFDQAGRAEPAGGRQDRGGPGQRRALLYSEDGVSVSNLFSGTRARSMLT